MPSDIRVEVGCSAIRTTFDRVRSVLTLRLQVSARQKLEVGLPLVGGDLVDSDLSSRGAVPVSISAQPCVPHPDE